MLPRVKRGTTKIKLIPQNFQGAKFWVFNLGQFFFGVRIETQQLNFSRYQGFSALLCGIYFVSFWS